MYIDTYHTYLLTQHTILWAVAVYALTISSKANRSSHQCMPTNKALYTTYHTVGQRKGVGVLDMALYSVHYTHSAVMLAGIASVHALITA